MDNSHKGGLFGISSVQASQFAKLLKARKDVDEHKTLMSLGFVANAWSWMASTEFYETLCGTAISSRQARRMYEEVAAACATLPAPALRFRHTEAHLPCATCIVDGTVVRCRSHRSEIVVQKKSGQQWIECKPPASIHCSPEEEAWFEALVDRAVQERDPAYRLCRVDRTYSGKHCVRAWKFHVFCTLRGVPFAFAGPVPASQHDKKLYDGARMFEHKEDEVVLADLGYVGARHCVVPFKGRDLTDEQRRFNTVFGLVRSRIERMFAYFDLFRIFTHTDLQEENVKHAMEIVVAVMYCILAKDPQYEGTDTAEAPEGQRCHCNNTLVHAQTFDASAIRARYVELSKNVEFDPKKSHGA
jgi:hypothetical protein